LPNDAEPLSERESSIGLSGFLIPWKTHSASHIAFRFAASSFPAGRSRLNKLTPRIGPPQAVGHLTPRALNGRAAPVAAATRRFTRPPKKGALPQRGLASLRGTMPLRKARPTATPAPVLCTATVAVALLPSRGTGRPASRAAADFWESAARSAGGRPHASRTPPPPGGGQA